MSKIALTDLSVKRLPVPDKGQVTYFDTVQSNFGVRVSQGGTKSFVAVLGERRRYKTIGKYPAISLKSARKEAQKLILAQSSNPLERPTLSHSEALTAFLEHRTGRIKERTVSDYRRLLVKHFDFGSKSLEAVTTSDITSHLNTLKFTPSEQHHAFVAARTFYNWCVKQGHLESSPVARIAPTSATPARDRILTDTELATVYKHAEKFTKPFGTLVQLLIHTGMRRSEASHLHRDWIEGGILTIPATHTKNSHPHSIPLSEAVLELLEPLPDQLFISPRGVIFSNWGNSKKRFDENLEIPPYRIHDLRRTFASIHARLGTPIHLTEKLLNHVSGSFGGVHGIYNRYDYLPELREATNIYDSHIRSIL